MANKFIKSNLKQFLLLFTLAIFLGSISANVYAENGTIYGYVMDSEGKEPLKDIIIEVYEIGDRTNPIAQTKTSSNGSYFLALKNGTYEIRAIGGSDSWIYQKTKSDYVRDVAWQPRFIEVTGNSVTNVDFAMALTPWDLIAAAAFSILGLIIFDQILLRRNIHLIGLLNTLLFRLKRRISLMIHPPTPAPEVEEEPKPEKEEAGTYAGMPSKKKGTVAGVGTKKEVEEDVRLKTLQTFCPITKMKLVEISKDKLYLCPSKTCGTYYHYDAIAPMKACINCGTSVAPMSA